MKQHLFILFSALAFLNVSSQTYYMCSGTTSSSATNGNIYDSGGPNGSYQNGENCFFLIKAPCPGNITLTFNSFSTEQGYDYLRMYDGNTTSAPIINGYWGTGSIPPQTATSGEMLLEFYSDGSSTYPGFSATWTMATPNCAPIANFNAAVNACQGKANFTDVSTLNPNTWLWNFGDGVASNMQNPSHTYTAAGVYNVNLVVSNNFGNSTITKTISVNPISFNIGYNGATLMNGAISFTTNNTTGQVYTWNFGDGSLAGTANAIHTYTSMGTFNVGLTIASGSCITTSTMQIIINGAVGVEQFYLTPYNASIQPNPFVGSSELSLQLAENRVIRIEVLNQLGQLISVVADESMKAGEYRFELNDIPAGVNYIRIREGENERTLKLVSLK